MYVFVVSLLDHVALSLEVVGEHTTFRSDHLTSVYAVRFIALALPYQAQGIALSCYHYPCTWHQIYWNVIRNSKIFFL